MSPKAGMIGIGIVAVTTTLVVIGHGILAFPEPPMIFEKAKFREFRRGWSVSVSEFQFGTPQNQARLEARADSALRSPTRRSRPFLALMHLCEPTEIGSFEDALDPFTGEIVLREYRRGWSWGLEPKVMRLFYFRNCLMNSEHFRSRM
jgi:hypothetical protein